jgi:sulfofructose kinase
MASELLAAKILVFFKGNLALLMSLLAPDRRSQLPNAEIIEKYLQRISVMNEKLLDVIGLGASTVDLITLVDHFPTNRENQQALALTVEGGGPVATAMVTISRLGGKTAMIDSIGDDWAGTLVLEGFQTEGVSTDCIGIRSGYTTSISNILVSAKNGARAIMWRPGSVPEISLSELQKSVIRSAKIIHLNGRHWDACLEAVKLAKESNVRVSFDGGANRFRPELKTLLPLMDICIVAKDFAETCTGEADISKSAGLLLKEGPEIAVVTDGMNGSWVRTKDGLSVHQPAFLFPETVDTTGCGDSYHGAFLVGLLKGFPVEKAAAFASAVAAMNSQQLGGRSGLPGFGEVMKFLVSKGITL